MDADKRAVQEAYGRVSALEGEAVTLRLRLQTWLAADFDERTTDMLLEALGHATNVQSTAIAIHSDLLDAIRHCRGLRGR